MTTRTKGPAQATSAATGAVICFALPHAHQGYGDKTDGVTGAVRDSGLFSSDQATVLGIPGGI